MIENAIDRIWIIDGRRPGRFLRFRTMPATPTMMLAIAMRHERAQKTIPATSKIVALPSKIRVYQFDPVTFADNR